MRGGCQLLGEDGRGQTGDQTMSDGWPLGHCIPCDTHGKQKLEIKSSAASNPASFGPIAIIFICLNCFNFRNSNFKANPRFNLRITTKKRRMRRKTY